METSIADLGLVMEARETARSGRGERLRLAAGLSQGELAAAIGVTPACISRWEAGDRRPRGAAAVAYAQLLRELAERMVAA
jgi:DNA-binding transcriptional regulator YiaG